MKKNKSDLEYGLISEIPDDAPAAWGGRAIQQKDMLDFVFDRQDMFAIDEGHLLALKTLLNESGVMPEYQKAYTAAYNRGELLASEPGVVTLFENNVLVVKADTRGSYGYVYLCAYLKSGDDPTKATWSGEKPVPAVGETIFNACNNIGQAVVMRRQNIAGYVHLWCWPTKPPAYYKKQNKLGRKGWGCCTCVGVECLDADEWKKHMRAHRAWVRKRNKERRAAEMQAASVLGE